MTACQGSSSNAGPPGNGAPAGAPVVDAGSPTPQSPGTSPDAAHEITPTTGSPTPGVLPNFPGTRGNYGNGHLRFSFPANGKTITVYAPQKPRDGLPWVWHGEFPDEIPNTNNAWLARGLMIVYVGGASEMYGCPDVVKVWEAAYATLVGTYHMASKMVITGISRGGLYAYNFAATHPDQPRAPELVREYVRYGASPRGAQALVTAGKIFALLDGRFNVSVDDIRAAALPSLRHRIILNFEGEAEGITTEAAVRTILDSVAPPAVE